MKKLEQKLMSYIEEHSRELDQLLSDLVKIKSINFDTHGDEEKCEDLIMGEYRKLGLDAEKYYSTDVPGVLGHPDYLPGRDADRRPNFSGTYRVSGAKKKLMLAAHTDVMPVGDVTKWSVDPFGGVIKDGRIYGRGSCDNKFGIASSIMAMKAIQECGIVLDIDVVLESYSDEEYGGGNGALAASLKHDCDAIINTDGGNYEIWSCSMGGQILEIAIQANEPQDSSKLAVDALMIVREELRTFIQNRHKELKADRYFVGTDMERSAFRFYEFLAGDGGLGMNLDRGMMSFVFYTNKTQEHIQEELSVILRAIKTRLDEINVSTNGFRPRSRFFHCLSLPDEDVTLQTIKKAAEEVVNRPVPITGACLSDLSLFLKYGSPVSLNFGIIRDFQLYGGAHQYDEYVEQKQLHEHCKAIALFLIRWCGAHEAAKI
ncbi:MAG: M20/M25/M40 family metallo-hydrolase [Clostridia bacterium]|nr:M20/M25/M40 family metallo-hydrolase [Clostridia bacterium]